MSTNEPPSGYTRENFDDEDAGSTWDLTLYVNEEQMDFLTRIGEQRGKSQEEIIQDLIEQARLEDLKPTP